MTYKVNKKLLAAFINGATEGVNETKTLFIQGNILYGYNSRIFCFRGKNAFVLSATLSNRFNCTNLGTLIYLMESQYIGKYKATVPFSTWNIKTPDDVAQSLYLDLCSLENSNKHQLEAEWINQSTKDRIRENFKSREENFKRVVVALGVPFPKGYIAHCQNKTHDVHTQ